MIEYPYDLIKSLTLQLIVMVILVTSKNEEDPIKIKGARVATTLNIDFSNIQGQLAPQP